MAYTLHTQCCKYYSAGTLVHYQFQRRRETLHGKNFPCCNRCGGLFDAPQGNVPTQGRSHARLSPPRLRVSGHWAIQSLTPPAPSFGPSQTRRQWVDPPPLPNYNPTPRHPCQRPPHLLLTKLTSLRVHRHSLRGTPAFTPRHQSVS